MMKVSANDAGNRPKEGYVGPYWFVQDSSGNSLLIAHRCALSDAEEYGDFLTSPHGHYDLWESWKSERSPGGLADIVREAEYEEWPRGRVVFNFVRGQFVVYGDSQIFEHERQHRVLEYFGIPANQVQLSKDEHYQSTRLLHRS